MELVKAAYQTVPFVKMGLHVKLVIISTLLTVFCSVSLFVVKVARFAIFKLPLFKDPSVTLANSRIIPIKLTFQNVFQPAEMAFWLETKYVMITTLKAVMDAVMIVSSNWDISVTQLRVIYQGLNSVTTKTR